MLVGVKTWAVAHLLANGDLGGIILFGSVLAWAVYDRITLKHRSDPGGPSIPSGGLKNDIAAVVRRHRPLSRARLRVPPAGGRAARFRHPRIWNLTCRSIPRSRIWLAMLSRPSIGDGEAQGGAALLFLAPAGHSRPVRPVSTAFQSALP